MTPHERNWVWRSDENSRAAGKISILAVVETIAAVAFYWWLAFQIDTAFMLIASPIVAFLVLLRSPQSIAEGVRMYDEYLAKQKPDRRNLIVATALCFCLTGALSYLLSKWFLLELSVLPLIWWSAILGLLALNSGVALAIAFTGMDSCDVPSPVLGAAAGGVAASIAVAFSGAGIIAAVAIIVVVAIIGLQAMVSVLGPGFAGGLAIRVLTIRCYATMRFLKTGIEHFLANWLNFITQQDMITPPILLPGLTKDHQMNFGQFVKSGIRDKSYFSLNASSLVFFYLPSILYRLTLKSTAWLYLPVIWMAHVPTKLREEIRQEVWVKTVGRNWLALFSALAVLAYALYLAFDPDAFASMRQANDTQMFTPFHLIWAIDPAGWKLWFWVTIPSAGLTIIMWIWVNKIRAVVLAGGQLDWHSTQLRCLIAANQIKNAFVIAWMLMTFLSVARAGWLLGKLPDWMEPIFLRFVLPVTGLWSS